MKLPPLATVNAASLSGANLKAWVVQLYQALASQGQSENARAAITASATLLYTQSGLLLVDATAGNILLTLPTSGSTSDDAFYNLRRIDSSTNTVTVQRGGTDTLEGVTTGLTVQPGGLLELQLPAGATNWRVCGLGGATALAAKAAIGLATARVDVATGATLDITAGSPTGDDIRTTGTTTVTLVNLAAGRVVRALAGGSYTITNGANVACVTGANIVARVGDLVTYRATALNVVEVSIVRASPIVMGTTVATTSGTSIDFTGIPADAKRIVISHQGVSTSGSSALMLRLGTSGGGIDTSGYTSFANNVVDAGASIVATNATGFILAASWNAAYTNSGQIILTLLNPATNLWACTLGGAAGASSVTFNGSGNKALASALDRVRLTTSGGTDTFDAGSMNITWEC